ncbi:unnamed protein product [marine sediment metagenome]|uniref:Gfo/Idh/MocA-like oxidoreductase N-terminal domain-containing protein n=1 Tax=marine sediment metagenome TaxID=412755 RepID=X1A928_9ZZZZ
MKISIIGCGKIAGSHIMGIKKNVSEYELSLCDTIKFNAESIGEKENIKAIYTDVDELLAKERPDSFHLHRE